MTDIAVQEAPVAQLDGEPSPDTGTTGAAPDAPQPSRLARTIGGLASVNGAMFAAAMITGPAQAHALGPVGRGEIAEILVPISLGSIVMELGLGVYAMREAARGRSPGVLLGTMGTLLLLLGGLAAICAEPVATALVGHRQPVHSLLIVGLLLLPLGLLSNLAGGICAGLELWRAYSLSRLIPSVGAAIGMVVLLALGALTVESVAVLSFVLGGLALVPLLVGLRGRGAVRFERAVATEGVRYGTKAWLGTLIGTANVQLGQLVTISVAGPATVGLLAVASNVAGSTDMLSSSVFGAIFPRVASGDNALAARAVRMTVLLVGAVSLAAGLSAPILVPLVFGSSFGPSVPIVELLLVATVLSAASNVFAAVLNGAGRPGLLAIGDAMMLAISIPGLIVLLPLLGGIGAALAYLGASLVVFVYLLFWCSRVSSIRCREWITFQRRDLQWLWARIGPVLTRYLSRRRTAARPSPELS
jgi:O-antigen/teichoic acid export membrane protein